MANTRIQCMVAYEINRQTDEKKNWVCLKHTHTQRSRYTNDGRNSTSRQSGKKRRNKKNNNSKKKWKTHNEQSTAHKSLNNWYEAKIVFESTLHVTYYIRSWKIHRIHIHKWRYKYVYVCTFVTTTTYRFLTDWKGTSTLFVFCWFLVWFGSFAMFSARISLTMRVCYVVWAVLYVPCVNSSALTWNRLFWDRRWAAEQWITISDHCNQLICFFFSKSQNIQNFQTKKSGFKIRWLWADLCAKLAGSHFFFACGIWFLNLCIFSMWILCMCAIFE